MMRYILILMMLDPEYIRYMEGRGYEFRFRLFPNDVYKLRAG